MRGIIQTLFFAYTSEQFSSIGLTYTEVHFKDVFQDNSIVREKTHGKIHNSHSVEKHQKQYGQRITTYKQWGSKSQQGLY